jgi:hypothetical protein
LTLFEPEPGSFRFETICAAIACAVAIPIVGWWKDFDWALLVPITIGVFCLMTAADFYKLHIRGRDVVRITDDELRVQNRRKTWSVRWTDVAQVYFFKQQIAFESPPPHRRWYLSLEGHEEHEPQLLRAIAERARAKNLAWFDTLASFLG